MRLSAALLAVATILGGCLGFEDKGSSFMAQNDAERDVIARMTVAVYRSGLVNETRAVTIPARSQLVFAIQPFAGDRVQVIEFLDPDCRSLGQFYPYDGGKFAISPTLNVTQQREFPEGNATAVATEACPAPSVAPSGASPVPS